MGSEMNLVSSQFDRQDKSIDALTARNQVLNKEIDTQKEKVSTLEKALLNAATSFGDNDKRTRAWQIQLNNANADLNNMVKELENNNKALNTAGNGFDEAEEKASDFDKKVKESAATADNAGARFEKLGGVLKGIGVAIGVALVGAGAAVAKISDEYIAALNDLQSATGSTTSEMGQFRKSMDNIFKGNYGEGFDDIGKALTVVSQSSKNISTAEIEKLTTDALLLRDTFDYDVSESVRAVNMLTKQFGITGEEAFNLIAQGTQKGLNKNGDFLDSINEYSVHYANLGISVEGMFNSLKNGTDAGTFSVDKLGDAVKEFGIRVKDESKTTAEAFTKLGLNANEIGLAFAQGGDKAGQAFNQVIEKIKEMNDPLAQNQVGVALFGTMWEDLGKEGVFALSNLNGEIDKSAQTLNKINEIKFSSISEAISGLGRMFTADFILPISNSVLPVLSQLGTALREADGDWNKISTAIGGAIKGLINAIMEGLPQILTLGTEIILTLLKGLIDALPAITEGALKLIMALLDGIIANLPALVEGAIQMVITLANGIGEALPKLIPSVVDAILLIVGTLLQNMDKILDAAFKIIAGLAKGLIDSLPSLIKALPKIISSIITFITSNLPKIIEMGSNLTNELSMGLIKAVPLLVAQLPQIVTAILVGIGQAVVSIVEIGKNIVKGLWEGITGMAGWIQDKIGGFVGGIVGNVKGLLGIHSPSTVFADIGANMSKGLGIGFVRTMAEVERDMKKAIPTDFNISKSDILASISGTNTGLNESVFVPSGSNAMSSYGNGIVQNITINSPTPLTPSEIARQIKNTSRQMALEW